MFYINMGIKLFALYKIYSKTEQAMDEAFMKPGRKIRQQIELVAICGTVICATDSFFIYIKNSAQIKGLVP